MNIFVANNLSSTKTLIFFQGPSLTQSFPFLYSPSAITTFISSASSASATPDTNSNIQDFTKQAHHEPKKLQTDQDLDQSSSPSSGDGNEVVPSIIQKKITKILRKIQFITQFSSGGENGGSNSNNGGGEPSDFDDFFKDDDDEEETEAQTTEASEENNDKKGEVEEITVSASSTTTTTTEKPSKYSVSPSSIAVFFMELVGTVMGLFYGAAAQIGNGQNARA